MFEICFCKILINMAKKAIKAIDASKIDNMNNRGDFMPSDMSISEVGNVYELRRNQWRGNAARITKDPALLEEVQKYTWTYNAGMHPYLRCSKLGISLHEFVMGYIYGQDKIDELQEKGCIVEHLDNNGLNCTYENLHVLSGEMNKTKAFSVDRMNKDAEDENFPAYVMDVYYLHDKKQFQMQILLNEDLFVNTKTGQPLEMIICKYNDFNDLFIDWFYLLDRRIDRMFEIAKLHDDQIFFYSRPVISDPSPEELNSPFIERDGVIYLNLSATKNGIPISVVRHTSLRRIDINNEQGSKNNSQIE